MKKLLIAIMICGLMMPHSIYAREAEMDGTGATEVSYTPSDLIITEPVEQVSSPNTGYENRDLIKHLLIFNGSLLFLLLLVYLKKEQEELEYKN